MKATSRRGFLRSLAATGLGATAGGVWLRGADTAPPRRPPNIVLIFADDLGWKDTGYMGSDFYETPNLDRLATEGVVFTSAYAAAGNCQPSRACLLSGQYTPRHGVYAVNSTDRGPKSLMRMIPIPNTPYLDTDNVTAAEALRSAGYATGHFGKWHLGGKQPGTNPADQGFDVTMDVRQEGVAGGVREDPKGIFAITQAACAFIEANRERPFFAYVAHHAIHVGLQARQETLDRFQAKTPGTQHSHALYAACTYDFDDGVGRLLGKLRELGLEENTVVVFTSDNGGTGPSSQEPLRGSKGSYYEGGIREPTIVRWPGVVRPGSRCDVPVINVDLYPTFLELAGQPPPADKVLDGVSLVPLLRGAPTLGREAIFWHFPGYLNGPVPRGRDPVFRTRPVSVVRKGDWKLHLYHEEWQLDGGRDALAGSNAVELYNLADDIGERTNLAASHAAKRNELLDVLLAWIAAARAPMPTERNPEYDPAKPIPQAGRGGRQRRQQQNPAPAEIEQ
ncbi:MAG: sulfatase [Lentisphaeria bacterium]|nr:sulfatase [Lentisphaeria bacterium]